MEILRADVLNVLCAYGVFVLVYIANILFSLYLNIEVLNLEFNKYKLGQSIKKAVVLVLATLMLVVAIDAAAAFFSSYIPELSEELRNTLTVLTIISTIGRAALKYANEAYTTFAEILSVKSDMPASSEKYE
jgi:hypothetical protein